MDMISKKRKTISYILKLIVILSAVVGTILSSRAGSDSFMGGNRVFMFFTIQSNIAVAAVCAAGAFLLMRGRPVPYAWYVVKLVGTVSITLTGVVFTVMLVPLLGDKAWAVHNTLTHAIVPAAAVADFFVTVSGTGIRKKDIVYVLVPPFFYVVYAGIGYVKGWEFLKGLNYPYFFLNWGSRAGAFGFSNELPYMGCIWWILLLLLFLLAVGWCYVTIAGRIRKSPKQTGHLNRFERGPF